MTVLESGSKKRRLWVKVTNRHYSMTVCNYSEHIENLPDPSVDILAGLFSVYVAHGIGEHGNKRTSPADEERVKTGARSPSGSNSAGSLRRRPGETKLPLKF